MKPLRTFKVVAHGTAALLEETYYIKGTDEDHVRRLIAQDGYPSKPDKVWYERDEGPRDEDTEISQVTPWLNRDQMVDPLMVSVLHRANMEYCLNRTEGGEQCSYLDGVKSSLNCLQTADEIVDFLDQYPELRGYPIYQMKDHLKEMIECLAGDEWQLPPH